MQRGHVRSASAGQHVFSRAPQAQIPRSQFDRSCQVKTTFDAGYLVPILCDEVLPGDTFNLIMEGFARLSTPLYPIMDNLYLDTFFFFVPNRLVWDHWEHFCGYQRDPGDSTDYIIPQIVMPASVGAIESSLADYFGIPTKVALLSTSTLPFRAYNLIYNDWFRDENLQDSSVVDVDDGPDTYTDYVLLQRGKRHDYFTSCLPFPQKGPDVSLPLGTQAPVTGIGMYNSQVFGSNLTPVYETGGGTETYPFYVSTAAVTPVLRGTAATGGFLDVYADLTAATASTINDLRLAFQTQKLYERDARGGTRYTEIVKSHFGVTSPDARLQRPEYLGGGSTPVLINPVAQTSATSGSNALGDLAGYGVCAPHGHGFTYSSTEHGYVIGLVSVRADLSYQQGLERHWSRQTRLDFYWPALSHLGEQAVLNKEIYAKNDANDDLVFGYQERYAEYRYKPSIITGLFRSNATGTLDAWHLAQNFSSLPVLNSTFIKETPPMSRIQAVTTEPDFIFDCFFKYKAARCMPVYAVPGLIDHF